MNRTETPVSPELNSAQPVVGLLASDRGRFDRLARAVEATGITQFRQISLSGGPERIEPVDVAVLHDGREGAALLESVRAARETLRSTTALVVVWPCASRGDARRALRAGADGLVNEADLEDALGATIRAVSCGLTCIPQSMRAPIETESLSMREKQVLGMVVMGFSNSEIASKLFLAESTVKSHLSSAYMKLGVRSRKDAANLILDPMEGLAPGILAIAGA